VLGKNLVGLTPRPLRLDIQDAVLEDGPFLDQVIPKKLMSLNPRSHQQRCWRVRDAGSKAPM